jgi:hypothetical protein
MPQDDSSALRRGPTNWQPGIQLQPPVAMSTEFPTAPAPAGPMMTPVGGAGVQLGTPSLPPRYQNQMPPGVSPVGFPRP